MTNLRTGLWLFGGLAGLLAPALLPDVMVVLGRSFSLPAAEALVFGRLLPLAIVATGLSISVFVVRLIVVTSRWLSFLAVVLAYFATVVILSLPILHARVSIGYESLLPHLAGSTVWAPGFSEEAFLTLRPGMSQEEVSSILGEPLRRFTEGDAWA